MNDPRLSGASRNPVTDHLDLWTSALLIKSTAGRGSNGRLEAYGIKKLRGLILELAMRGKLVLQDSNDEPADRLLKKITEEKARMISEGKLKQGEWSKVAEEEKPHRLPPSWQWARLPDVASYGVGKTPSTKTPAYWSEDESGIPWVSISDMEHYGVLENTGKKITKKAVEDVFGYEPISKGSLLMSFKLTVGKIAVLGVDAYHNEAIISLRPYSKIVRDFLFKVLPMRAQAGNTKRAIMGNTLNSSSLSLLLIPVPPLEEQHRIVAKVDELMALCDQLEQQQGRGIEAHQTLVETLLGTLTSVESAQEFAAAWSRIAKHFDTLFTTEHSIDQLKQAILQLAVMGKLVPQDHEDEPAKKLIKRKLGIDDENIPFKVPDSWVWVRVEEIAQTRLGKMLDKAKNKGKLFRYLRNINVRWFDFDLSDVKEMRFEEAEREEFSLRHGDVLICEGGYPGRAAVWDEREDNIYFQKAIHRVRFKNGVNPNYFVLVLRNSADSGRLSSYFTGAGIQHFTGKGLMSFLAPLPPLAEQHRIVAKVDELMVLCDAFKARLAEARATQIRLADAIVERAVVTPEPLPLETAGA